ncbi:MULTISPECIES: exosortase-associated protein EpsI, B-type [Silvimonas]|uniref:exosortase-associated protein EpsI, B-type n=1 Tax=Silvimonas TaxID=300264 RepID=UPI0024B3A161|nr:MULTISPECIES: exosortase-associated protein EpsI, B-type [Silvimonas]MDR3427058.1 EpsI family protein [Silvimonas sp.]
MIRPLTLPHWRPLLIAALIVSGPVLAWTLTPRHLMADSRQNVNLETMFPARIGEWQMVKDDKATVISPDVQAALERFYSQTLTRIYVNPQGYMLMLSIAYGRQQTDSLRVHNPEICYAAQGFALSGRSNATVLESRGELPIKRVFAQAGQRNEPISYWITVGDRVANETPMRKWLQIKYGLGGQVPDGALVRVSSIDPDVDRAYAMQDSFIGKLDQSLTADGVRMLLGQAS